MKYLKDIALEIRDIASEIPDVHTATVGDVTELNRSDLVYSAVVITPGEATYEPETGGMTYRFTVMYVDLQTADGSNVLDIQSHAVSVLCGLIDKLYRANSNVIADNIQPFSERLQALCSGAMVNIAVETDRYADCVVF